MIVKEAKEFRLSKERLKGSKIPPKLWGREVKDYADPVLQEKLRSILREVYENVSRGKSFLLYGPIGTGKTSFSAIFLRYAIARAAKTYFIQWEYFGELWLRDTYNNKPNPGLRERVLDSDVIVLDNYRGVYNDPKLESKFINFLEMRMEYGKTTLLTADMNRQTIKDTSGGSFGTIVRVFEELVKFDMVFPSVTKVESRNWGDLS